MTQAPDQPPARRPPRARDRVSSRVLVHTGDGKGKTSAAMGIVMRATARGWRVSVVQFVKDGRWKTGEEASARELGAEWWSIGDGFTWDSTDMDRTEAIAREAWRAARHLIRGGEHELVVLDEITYPMNWGWIEARDVTQTIRDRPSHVNVVVTGRDAPEVLCAVADTVTEMASVKHAFDAGVGAMRGIEY
jgi:cob(I)alamin adenosyltransferase